MSAQDARVIKAIRAGIDAGTDALRAPLVAVMPLAEVGWAAVELDVEAAIEKAVRAALEAAGIATGHVQITGGPEVTVGFEVLPPENTN